MSKKKILIIDDEEGFSQVLKVNLEFTGKYDVKVENHADNAVSAALDFQPDLVLLDIIMPCKEGPDVAFELKTQPLLEQVPIIFLTATVTQEEVDAQGGVIGGHVFVSKPSSLEHLLEQIWINLIPA